jgi:hypothetical protein
MEIPQGCIPVERGESGFFLLAGTAADEFVREWR